MRVQLTDEPTAFLSHDWTHVAEADAAGTFFHTPAYLKLWWEEFGTGSLVVGLAREGRDIVGACCFEIVDGLLTFLGGFDVTDYMGPVSLPRLESAVARELLVAVTGRMSWERADLRGLPDGSPWPEAVASAASALGIGVEVREDGIAPFIALPESFDGYLEALPARRRHEIRRKERRLREEAGDYRVVMSTEETIAADMDRFVELHQQSPGPKGRFMHAGMEIFFRRVGEAFLPRQVFHMGFLETGGEKAAGAIGFTHGDTFFLYNSAFDRRYAHLSPGMVLVGELIRLAIESGQSRFDLLKGDLAYKYRFGSTPRPVRRLLLYRC